MAEPNTELPMPSPGPNAAADFVASHLGHLVSDASVSPIRGGQTAADAALAQFDVTGYASRRNEVAPVGRRGASMLSPYIRHGLLRLDDVWQVVEGGPARDVTKFRDELLWQEFARHWYSRHGTATRTGRRRELQPAANAVGWDRTMACLDTTLTELESTGWLVNQTRMWLSSHWAIRLEQRWQDGEDEFFRHLLDGSRAANRLGWQWTTGVGSSKHYGFSRWQVEKRAPGLCDRCAHREACPIQNWPDDPEYQRADPAISRSVGPGPTTTDTRRTPELVWLTAESLGVDDPALLAYPDLPVLFVFDEPLLARLRLSSKRLVFLVETLAELAEHRDVRLLLGRPALVADLADAAVTFAPVPGFARIVDRVAPAELHPWPWLRPPTGGSVASFSAWRKGTR